MTLPLEAVPQRVAAVTWAVVRGARTVREVATACGWVSPSHPLAYLREARAAGLIDFDEGHAGTLHALYTVVAFTPR